MLRAAAGLLPLAVLALAACSRPVVADHPNLVASPVTGYGTAMADVGRRLASAGWVSGPSKVIWIRLGHCTTAEIGQLLHNRVGEVRGVARDPDAAFLSLA